MYYSNPYICTHTQNTHKFKRSTLSVIEMKKLCSIKGDWSEMEKTKCIQEENIHYYIPVKRTFTGDQTQISNIMKLKKWSKE